ncbi:hypothetical protein LTR17_013946 [Elasticomyces elasticus]|nr:hypothetical protein LTR17_013946 [Elasticomyces elasticus]
MSLRFEVVRKPETRPVPQQRGGRRASTVHLGRPDSPPTSASSKDGITEDHCQHITAWSSMGSSGKLTRSGLLYEGNYTEWRDRISDLLEIRGVNVEEVSCPSYHDWSGLAKRQRNIDLITDHISPALLSRISATDLTCPKRLLSSVQNMAKPFRLDDLPPELRSRIFGFHFGNAIIGIIKDGAWMTYKINNHEVPDHWSSRTVPDLLLVSRLMNTEALPIFYKTNWVAFDAPSRDDPEEEELRGPGQVRRWAERKLAGNIKFLRVLGPGKLYGGRSALSVELHDRVGLFTTYCDYFPIDKQQAWDRHVPNVEMDRGALGLKGEALVLCLTSRTELWQ